MLTNQLRLTGLDKKIIVDLFAGGGGMSVAYGSNGVRDYFRGVARAALSGESKC